MLRTVVSIVILAMLAGCSTYRNVAQETLPTLPQQYAQFDVKMGWKATTDNRGTIIDGVVKNIRYFEMDDLEIWVWVLDNSGREQLRAMTFVPTLRENQAAPFAINLPPLPSGTRLSFMYRYLAYEGGGDSGNADRWMQSFDAVLP